MADEKKSVKGARPLRSDTHLGAPTGAGGKLATASTLGDIDGIGEGQAAATSGLGAATNFEGAEHLDMFTRFVRQNTYMELVAAYIKVVSTSFVAN